MKVKDSQIMFKINKRIKEEAIKACNEQGHTLSYALRMLTIQLVIHDGDFRKMMSE